MCHYMIPSANPTVPPVAILIFIPCLFCDILKSTDGNMCENNDHYQRGLWVGRVDQLCIFC